MSRSREMLTGQTKIAELAAKARDMSFTSINQYLTKEWLLEAYRRTRKDGAVGIDGQTAEDYAAKLDENIESLLKRVHSGQYFAPPVRRVHIPKGTGSQELRPLGIPTFEDKLLQRAVVMLLEPIYEQDFLTCSYGFRPGRSQHQAVKGIQNDLYRHGGWVIDVDVKKFFDTLEHKCLRELLSIRIRDGVVTRLIGKWLKSGVMEGERLSQSDVGCPQGGVISPLLSNVYLHYVLDLWLHEMVRPCLRGKVTMHRWADDFVIICSEQCDAERIMQTLPKRFAKYGLTIHPDKTRLVDFRKPSADMPRPGTFDFLGFTFYWGTSRRGNPCVFCKTQRTRLRRGLQKAKDWCRNNRHQPVRKQHRYLQSLLRGHYQYYGVTGNMRSLAAFRMQVRRIWRYWLNRRSEKRQMPWERFVRLLNVYPLALPYIAHSDYIS